MASSSALIDFAAAVSLGDSNVVLTAAALLYNTLA